MSSFSPFKTAAGSAFPALISDSRSAIEKTPTQAKGGSCAYRLSAIGLIMFRNMV